MAMTAAARAIYDALWLEAFVVQEQVWTDEDWYYINEMEAERAAELANERSFEDRGWLEAQAEREWEDSRGVIQFEDAMADAARWDEARWAERHPLA